MTDKASPRAVALDNKSPNGPGFFQRIRDGGESLVGSQYAKLAAKRFEIDMRSPNHVVKVNRVVPSKVQQATLTARRVKDFAFATELATDTTNQRGA
jgi:hypothetical protein